MNPTGYREPLDGRIRRLLTRLRWAIRSVAALDVVLFLLAVVLGAFWIGLAADWGPARLGGQEMPRSARALLLAVVLAAVGLVVLRGLYAALLRPLPDDSLALLVERRHPELGGRLVTAVQLARRGREASIDYSPHLLSKVHDQAAALVDRVRPSAVFRWRPIQSKLLVVLPLLVALALLAALHPAMARQGAARLLLLSDENWPRRASLEMVGLEVPVTSLEQEAGQQPTRLEPFENRVARLARGSSAVLRVRAAAEDAQVPDVCTVYFRTASGNRGQTNMRRTGRVQEDGYQLFTLDGPPLDSITENLVLDVHGLDDRLDDFRVEVVEPPAILAAELVSQPPAYLRDDPALAGMRSRQSYRPGVRIREGATVELIGQSNKPLSAVRYLIERGEEKRRGEVAPSEDGTRFMITVEDLREPASCRLLPVDEEGVAASTPYRYFLNVLPDTPPELELRLTGIGQAITPSARLPIEGTIDDDYGVAEARLLVMAGGAEGNGQSPYSEEIRGGREGAFEQVIDLRQLASDGALEAVAPGHIVTVLAEAADRYDLDGATHLSRSDRFPLEVVEPEELVRRLERRELALRSRLEQIITEVEQLRDWLSDLPSAVGGEPVALLQEDDAGDDGEPEQPPAGEREQQLRTLRIQQAALQAAKTRDELTGVAASVDDILAELVNNRVDSADRRERLARRVRDPLREVNEQQVAQLIRDLGRLRSDADDRAAASRALAETETALIRLDEILQGMLDLESYNELLDIVRDLIDQQDDLIEKTKEEQKQQVLDLFQ